VPESHRLPLTWKWGLLIIALFLVSFVAVMITRGVISNNPLLYRLFSNMYLAGTIIFGGGPVVIPLLREYVVAEGWVSGVAARLLDRPGANPGVSGAELQLRCLSGRAYCDQRRVLGGSGCFSGISGYFCAGLGDHTWYSGGMGCD